MGFPFELAHVNGDFPSSMNIPSDYDLAVYNGSDYGDFWVKSYDGSNFNYSPTIEENIGYIFQFPEAFENVEVTFISEPGVTLQEAAFPDDSELSQGYNLVLNQSLRNLTATDHCYLYHSTTNSFDLAEGTESIKPFEAFILAKEGTPRVQSISVSGTITGLKNTIATTGNDPVIATRYYSLQGKEIQQPLRNGVYIVKKIHASQNVEITKEFYNK
jgi:hypothetical protein